MCLVVYQLTYLPEIEAFLFITAFAGLQDFGARLCCIKKQAVTGCSPVNHRPVFILHHFTLKVKTLWIYLIAYRLELLDRPKSETV